MPPKKPLYCSETMLCPPSIFLLLLKNSLSIELGEKIIIIEQLTKLSNHQIYSLIEVWTNEQREFAQLLKTDEYELIRQKANQAKRDWAILDMVYDFPTFDDDPDTHHKLLEYLPTIELIKLGEDLDILTNKEADEQERLSVLQRIDPDTNLDIHADDFLDKMKGIIGGLFNNQNTDNPDDLLVIHSDIKQ